MKQSLLLKDFKYFTLIILLLLAVVLVWVPVKILSLFFKERPARAFVALFEKFD